MYILANSGIEREGVANFWRRMSVENPRSISYASTHPSSSERWVNIEAVNKEIDKKILKSESLLPERIQTED
jgi:predicted Zn-dependent protease